MPFADDLGCGQLSVTVTPEEASRVVVSIRPAQKLSHQRIKRSASSDCKCSALEKCDEVYVELAKCDYRCLKKVNRPSLEDHIIKPEEFDIPGAIQKRCRPIVRQMLCGARRVLAQCQRRVWHGCRVYRPGLRSFIDYCDQTPGRSSASSLQCSRESDAPSAYVQSKLGADMKGNTPVSWMRLRYQMWRQKCKDLGLADLVCPLRLSLYGHLMSGY